MIRLYLTVFAITTLILTGCSGFRTAVNQPDKRPLGKSIGSAEPKNTESGRAVYTEPADTITIKDALSLALLHNPALTVFALEIRVREAAALQASLFPNPELDFEMENLGGSGAFKGMDAAETTISVGQLFELAGKREKRTKIAALESDLAAWDYEAKRLDVFTEVVKTFTSVLAAQERVSVNKELLALAEAFVKTIQRQVEAGKISPAELSRARVELSMATIEIERARRELEAARRRLAATWGSTDAAFTGAKGVFRIPNAIPSFDDLMIFIKDNPDIARWATEIERRQAEWELEKAKRIPDPTVSGGFRHLSENSDNAFVVGLSVPIPFFNRNQGAVQEAEYRLKQTEVQRRSVQTTLSTILAQNYQSVSALYSEVSILKNRIIPGAQNAFDIISEGYLLGKFTSLDVLDAQRTLFETRIRFLRSLNDLHQTVAEIERLIGRSLADIK